MSTYYPSPHSIRPITSPAASHASITSTTSTLPTPRSRPLRAGSAKEDAARRYVEGRLLGISRRYVKKFQDPDDRHDTSLSPSINPDANHNWQAEAVSVRGYTSFREVAADYSEVVDVLWLSGTPSLQVPYLLGIALDVQEYLPAFPPSPRALFSLLRKLDTAFATLLLRGEVDVGTSLSEAADSAMLDSRSEARGSRTPMSRTEMIRCRAIVQGTRVAVVDIMATASGEEDESSDAEQTVEDSDDDDLDREISRPSGHDHGIDEMLLDVDEEGENDMDIAKVYERTITALGKALGGTADYDASHPLG